MNKPAVPVTERIDIPVSDVDFVIRNMDIHQEEIVKALVKIKNWKAPGHDGITAEMLKADDLIDYTPYPNYISYSTKSGKANEFQKIGYQEL